MAESRKQDTNASHLPFSAAGIAFSALGLWFVSLFLPALGTACAPDATRWYSGLFVLNQGPFGLIMLEPGWYANVFLLFSLIGLFRGRLRYSVDDGIGLALALSSFQPNLFVWGNGGGDGGPVCARGIGFWLWLASFVMILIPEVWIRRQQKKISPKT